MTNIERRARSSKEYNAKRGDCIRPEIRLSLGGLYKAMVICQDSQSVDFLARIRSRKIQGGGLYVMGFTLLDDDDHLESGYEITAQSAKGIWRPCGDEELAVNDELVREGYFLRYTDPLSAELERLTASRRRGS